MQLFADAYRYLVDDDHLAEFVGALLVHLRLSFGALAIAIALCVPLGILVARRQRIAPYVMNAVGTLRVIPSLAILFLALPYLGIGFRPALVALTVLACPPVLLNTYAAFRGVDRAVIEAAQGMGMSPWQVLRAVEWPLALPVVIAGIRTAAVEVIASATLAAFIGGGGLGNYIERGFGLLNNSILLIGALPVALLSVSAELGLGWFQRRVSPLS
jgi:osmoprotectant transport system permease protein